MSGKPTLVEANPYKEWENSEFQRILAAPKRGDGAPPNHHLRPLPIKPINSSFSQRRPSSKYRHFSKSKCHLWGGHGDEYKPESE